MNSSIINIIGYFALGINLYSMSTKGEYKLRLISLIANSIYVVYSILLGAFPIIVGGIIAVLLHTFRLSKLKKI